MFCANCSKLAFNHLTKECRKCRGAVYFSISSICEPCSNTDKNCAACLKKLTPPINKNKGPGCGPCGR